MSNKKINQLPLYTGDTAGAYFIMNNSGETTTYKVTRETILGESQTSGTSGTSGINGSSGTSGVNGTNGSSGTSGVSGTSGSSGTSGVSGTSGSSGTSGIDGLIGSHGTSGTSGVDGTSGTSGLGFVWQGIWQSSPTTYVGGQDIVYYDGGSFIKIGDGNSGSAPPFDSIRWDSFARAGSSGDDGSSGTSGSDGSSGSNGSSGTSGGNGSSGSDGSSGTSGSDALWNFLGPYQVLDYNIGDVVTHEGQTWYCIQFAPIGAGPYGGFIGVKWTLIAASGTAGTSGTNGESGSSGTSGSSGGTGTSGSNGSSGTSGIDGSSGTSGNNGSSGTSGTSGDTGSSGTSGTSGTSGSSGTSPVNVLLKTTGTWTVPTGASTQSFTVDANSSYSMWVNGNIPNGILNWNATATISNTNVPVVGAQYGWYYLAGNALVLTSMPNQFVGTNGSILNSPAEYAPNTSNVFNFGITNNSGTSQTINYGYIKLS